MKRMKKLLGVILTCAAMVMSVCACGASPEKEAITVTFMNGDTQLGQISGSAGETLSDYAQYETIDGFEFLGWYETPTLLETSKKDLASATFSKDTTLFGSFKSLQVAEDTRVWYIVGTGGNPNLAASNWAADVDASVKEACQLKATGNTVNEFAITLNLYEGDQFQIIHDWAWDGQKGYGCFTSIDDSQMANGGGLSGEDSKSNINVLMDGNYTVTLTTDPDNALQDTLTIVRNGDATEKAKEPEPEKVYEVTDATGIVVKGSWVSDWSENKELTRVEGTNSFTISLDLAAGTELYFMVFDNGEDTGLGMNGSAVTDEASKALLEEAYNVKVATDGTYTFTVDAETMTITVEK